MGDSLTLMYWCQSSIFLSLVQLVTQLPSSLKVFVCVCLFFNGGGGRLIGVLLTSLTPCSNSCVSGCLSGIHSQTWYGICSMHFNYLQTTPGIYSQFFHVLWRLKAYVIYSCMLERLQFQFVVLALHVPYYAGAWCSSLLPIKHPILLGPLVCAQKILADRLVYVVLENM